MGELLYISQNCVFILGIDNKVLKNTKNIRDILEIEQFEVDKKGKTVDYYYIQDEQKQNPVAFRVIIKCIDSHWIFELQKANQTQSMNMNNS